MIKSFKNEFDFMQLKKFPYSDILGWSASRFEKFNSCKRQYYYDYYAKRHDKEINLTQLNKLRNLTSAALETGNIAHDVIKSILERLMRSSKPIDHSRLLAYAENLSDTYCDSKEFHEVFYGYVSQIDKNEIKQKVKDCIANLISSERFIWLMEKAVPHSDNWLVEPDGYGETRLAGLKAYCKVDFLFKLEDKIYIIDWKTGKEDEIKQARQLKGYTAFARDHFNVIAENVVCILFFLKEGREREFLFSTTEIDEFVDSIRIETDHMYAYTSDTRNNIPLPKNEFTCTENISTCRLCNYRALCFPS